MYNSNFELTELEPLALWEKKGGADMLGRPKIIEFIHYLSLERGLGFGAAEAGGVWSLKPELHPL